MQQEYRQDGPADHALAALKHRFALLLAFAVLGLGAGWAYGNALPASFTSSASVLVNPVEGNPYAPSERNDPLTSLETEAQIVRSDAVLRSVSQRSPAGLSPAELEDHVNVVVPANTQILQISYQAADPGVARDTAQGFAVAYLEHRRQRAAQVTAAQIATLDGQIRQVASDLARATAASRRRSGADKGFQAELARALNSELVSLRAQRFTIESTVPEPGRVISPASLPVAGRGLAEVAFPAAGTLAGLLLGLSLGVLLERKRGLVRTPCDLRAAGVPVLAWVRRPGLLRRWSAATSRNFDEAVRRARAAILDTGISGPVVAVGACSPDGHQRVVTDALAVCFTRIGAEVVLVDAARGSEAGDAAPAGAPGLTDLVAGGSQDGSCLLVPTATARLKVLPAGRMAPESSDSFVRDRLHACLSPLAAQSDFVVVGTPALLTTQGEAMSRAADVTVVVVTSGRTRKSDMATVAQRAYDAGTPVLGAVLLPRRGGLRRNGSRRPALSLEQTTGPAAVSAGREASASVAS